MTASPNGTTAASRIADVPLIPRDLLFGNPERSGGKISPDGRWLSWMAPWEGVMNVFMAPYADPAAERRMTSAKDRPIPQYFWSPDSTALLYVQDKEGDENYLLYKVDVASGAETCLTPFENTRVQIVGASETIRDRILVGLNNRDPQWHDVWSLNLTTGALDLVLENNAWAGFEADDSLTLRWAVRQNAAGGTDMHEIVDGVIAEAPGEVVPMDDSLTTHMAGYTTDGATLYWLDSRGRDTAALYAEDTATGERTLLAEDPRADIGGTLRHTTSGVIQAWSVTYLRTEWHCVDEGIKSSLDWLRAQLDGDFGVLSRTDDDLKWLVWNDPLTAPVRCYIYDRERDDAAAVLCHQAGAGGCPAAADAVRGNPGARRADPALLPHPAGGWRKRAGAHGAAGPRRALGARCLWLQPHAPVAGEPRLWRAVGQLPRLHRLRQALHQCRQPAMVEGPCTMT
jgi:hypothetical protein